MSSPFTAIDLSSLPAPSVVEQLDYEDIFAAMLADLQDRDSSFTALVESDPAYKILEVCAARELLLRQRVNEACRQVMLAYASDTNLDNLAALYGLARQDGETDSAFRRRIQLSVEGFSTAGPIGAYLFHALNVEGVKDASVTSPAAGQVLVTVMGKDGDGTASAALLSAVDQALNAEYVRPLTDQVSVQAAAVIEYEISAVITTYDGPDSTVVLASARAALDAVVVKLHGLGLDVARSAIFAALHQSGVQHVELVSPAADVVITETQVAYCAGITLTHGGTDE